MALDRPQRLPCLPDQGAHPQIGRTAAVLLADIYVLCRASLPLAITTTRTVQSRLRLRQIRPPTSLLPEEPCHLSPSSARRSRRLAAALSRRPLPPFFSPRSQLAGPRLVAPQPSRHNLTPPPPAGVEPANLRLGVNLFASSVCHELTQRHRDPTAQSARHDRPFYACCPLKHRRPAKGGLERERLPVLVARAPFLPDTAPRSRRNAVAGGGDSWPRDWGD
jgi:hypothetical protein